MTLCPCLCHCDQRYADVSTATCEGLVQQVWKYRHLIGRFVFLGNKSMVYVFQFATSNLRATAGLIFTNVGVCLPG